MPVDWRTVITLNPEVLAGKPTIRGLRVGVEQILRSMSSGQSVADILKEYPDLHSGDIAACQAYAADLIASERVYPMSVGKSE
ncbi:MAG TPA: DUF433 domain-containing protein [Gemmatales bacterium]|nr:DUF433 domain-containing protein [Gemmatales bacterium]HMP17968.1 DUF433 domain-containing protein [Gemmatales bacterium]